MVQGFDDLPDDETLVPGEVALRLGFQDWERVLVRLAEKDLPPPSLQADGLGYRVDDIKRWIGALADERIGRLPGSGEVVSLERERLRRIDRTGQRSTAL